MKYWSPKEKNTLRSPRPAGDDWYAVEDDADPAFIELVDGKPFFDREKMEAFDAKLRDDENKRLEKIEQDKLDRKGKLVSEIARAASVDDIKKILRDLLD